MDLVPNIASGDLAESSLAEVVAAAFRANASGAVAVEQGPGESRVYLRYGSPCGTQIYLGFRPFLDYLGELGVLEQGKLGRARDAAEQRKVDGAEVLITDGFMTADRVAELLAAYHHDALLSLCVLREGKYELRGWEPPPEWTESIRLDPLQAIISAMRTDELFDRRQAIVQAIGNRGLRLAEDFEEVVGRLVLDAHDDAAIRRLQRPMTAPAFLASLGREDAEAALAAYALLGLVDEALSPTMRRVARPVQTPQQQVHDAADDFVLTVEAPPPVPSGPSRRDKPDAGAGRSQTRMKQVSRPPEAPVDEPQFSLDTPSSKPSSSRWLTAMASQLEVGVEGASGEASAPVAEAAFDMMRSVPGEQPISLGPPISAAPAPPPVPSAPRREVARPVRTPASQGPRQVESRTGGGELEFDPGEEESLELDLARAPVEILRARPRPARGGPAPAPSVTRIPTPAYTSLGGKTAARAGPVSAPKVIARKARDEYNPFAVHFQKAGATAEALDALADERTEVVLKAPPAEAKRPQPVAEARFEQAVIEPEDATVPIEAERAAEKPGAPAPPVAADAERKILDDIASLVGAAPDPEPTPPLDLPEEPSSPGQGDTLALEAAVEQELVAPTTGNESIIPGVLPNLTLPEEAVVVTTAPPLDLPEAEEHAASEPASAGHEEEVVEAAAPLAETKPDPEPPSSPPPSATGEWAIPPVAPISKTDWGTPAPEQPASAQTPAPGAAGTSGPPISGTPIESPPPAATSDPRGSGPESSSEVRRRLLQRAIRSVGGPFAARDSSPKQSIPPENVRTPDPVAPRPATADTDLERDILGRVAKAGSADHFAQLDLDRGATTEQVKDAFLSMAKKYHPDRISSLGQPHLLGPARDLFARIKEAYDVLLDPVGRAKHVSELEGKSGGSKLSADDARAAYQRALVYAKRRDLKQAEAELIRAIDSDPQPDYQAELASVLMTNSSRRDEAREEIASLVARALKAAPDCSDRVYTVAAQLARLEGKTDKMEKYFRDALDRNPKNVEAARELRLIEMRRSTEKPKASGLFDRFRKK